jgi:hypothetical protein
VSRMLRKWTSLILAVVMLAAVVVIPVPKAQAAGASITISSLYTDTNYTGTSPVPADDSKVDRVTSNPIQVRANYFDIAESDLPNIYYEVTNAISGKVTAEKSDKAVRTGTNEITFQAVDLTEGLNKIILKFGSGSTTVDSEIGWVYFTPSTVISDLAINDAPIVDNAIYPKTFSSINSTVIISGKANNATVISAYNAGMDSFEKNAYPDNDGMFYLIGDESVDEEYANSPGVVALRGGDNFIHFEARNDSNSFKMEKNVIYNNGRPFPFQTKFFDSAKTVPTDSDLIARQLTLSTDQLTLDTYIKVDAEAGVPNYTNFNVAMNNTALVEFNFADLLNPVNTPDTSVDTYSLTQATSLSTSSYNVYHLTLKLNSITGLSGSKNKLDFTFGGLATPSTSSYSFTYENPSTPLILSVARGNGSLFSEDVTNDISSLPETIVVTKNSAASGVKFLIDGVAQPAVAPVGDTVTYTISNITEGNHTFNFQPLDSLGVENSTGKKMFNVRVTSSPYIIVQNIFNGKILDGEAAINAFKTEGIKGSVQNFSTAIAGNVLMAYVNGSKIADSSASTFPLTGQSFALPLGATFNDPSGTGLLEGKNTIKFEIYKNGALVRTQSYELYAFTKKAPYFESLLPVGAGSDFVSAQTADKYATKASKVSFSGIVYNANSVEVIKYYKEDGLDKTLIIPASQVTLTTVSTGKSSITVSEIELPYFNSDVRFEFTAKNAANLTATTSITITREPVPYNVVEPALFTNPKGALQANVNGNFVKIVIEADNADSVLIGKDEAVLRTPITDNRYLYDYTLKDLKTGANNIKFTVVRGSEKVSSGFTIFNANTNQPGAAYLLSMANKLTAFNSSVSINFPKGTVLKRSEADYNTNDSYLTSSRRIMFGIANSTDGRVDQNKVTSPLAKSRLANTSAVDRFSPASELFWIDAGVIPEAPLSGAPSDIKDKFRQDALAGGGLDPYDPAANSFFFTSRISRQQVVPSATGTLTLKFDPNIRNESWRYITVFRYSIEKAVTGGESSGWTNIGGVVDMGKNTITVPFDKFGYYQVMYMDRSYDDVTTHGYARDAMDVLYTKGIMNGKSDYTFSTTESITRAEFAEALVKVFEIPLNYSGDPTFVDVPLGYKTTLGEYKYIETAARAGIIRGTSMNRFDPNRSIIREDASVMIARAAELKLESDLTKASAALIKAFTDGASIQTYAGPSVLAISKAGFIEGIPNVLVAGQKETVRFEPGQNLSRADASMILIRVMRQQGKLPK